MLKFIRYSIILLISAITLISGCYVWVSWRAQAHLYTDMETLPYRQVALVLGTSKYLKNGLLNEYYQNRIDTAVKLYQAKKVDYFVVSGDNRRHNYNEPKQMQADLVKGGIPADRIQPDYAGFRTLDSVLRMDKVFGQRDYVIVSQHFHNQRALFLAHAHDQHPIAFAAGDPQTQGMRNVMLREVLARVKSVIDILTNKQAKFYGDTIAFPPEGGFKKQ